MGVFSLSLLIGLCSYLLSLVSRQSLPTAPSHCLVFFEPETSSNLSLFPISLYIQAKMSGQVSQEAVIVIVIAGAGLAVLMGYAVHSAFNRGRVDPHESAMSRNDDQDRYMRELREKRFAGIRAETRWPRRPMNTQRHNGAHEMETRVESPEY